MSTLLIQRRACNFNIADLYGSDSRYPVATLTREAGETSADFRKRCILVASGK